MGFAAAWGRQFPLPLTVRAWIPNRMRTHGRKAKSAPCDAGVKKPVGRPGAGAYRCHDGQACQARAEPHHLFGLPLYGPYAGALPGAGRDFVPGASRVLP